MSKSQVLLIFFLTVSQTYKMKIEYSACRVQGNPEFVDVNCTINAIKNISKISSYFYVRKTIRQFGARGSLIFLKPRGEVAIMNITERNLCPYLNGRKLGNLLILVLTEFMKYGNISRNCPIKQIESVELAVNLLDGSDVRGKKVSVQRAKFQMRGEYNPALKPKKKKKDKEMIVKMKERLFDWRPEKMRGERSKHERVVVLKNLFTPELFEKEVHLIIEYQNDLREECGKCGTVRKVVVYDRHPEGVAQVTMSDPEEADVVVQMMNGRFFGKRKLTAENWDGKTKFKIGETVTEAQKRLNNWDKFLETDEKNEKLVEQPPEQPASTTEPTISVDPATESVTVEDTSITTSKDEQIESTEP